MKWDKPDSSIVGSAKPLTIKDLQDARKMLQDREEAALNAIADEEREILKYLKKHSLNPDFMTMAPLSGDPYMFLKKAYIEGHKAAQAPVKWPTEDELHEFQRKNSIYDAAEVIEWLKNYMEKGEEK